MRRPRSDTTPKTYGSIHRDEAMPLAEFGRRMNLGERAQADAQRAGLRTVLFGRVKYVLGRDALEWLDSLDNGQGGPTQ